MKKTLAPLVVGLLVGLAISTAAVAFMRGDASLVDAMAEHVDSAAPDDSAVAEDATATLEHELRSAQIPSLVESPPDSASDWVESSTTALESRLEQVAVVSNVGSAPAGQVMETARLARLFGSMQPRDAARVLEHMSDDDVQVILTHLGNREAAAILGILTPERAAVISRTVIGAERSR